MIVEPWEQNAADHLMHENHLDPLTWHYTIKGRMADEKGWILVFKTRGVIPHVKALPITDAEIAAL